MHQRNRPSSRETSRTHLCAARVYGELIMVNFFSSNMVTAPATLRALGQNRLSLSLLPSQAVETIRRVHQQRDRPLDVERAPWKWSRARGVGCFARFPDF